MVIQFRIPKVPSMLLPNLVFVLGLLGVAVTVIGLAGPWVGGLIVSALATIVGWLMMLSASRPEQAEVVAPAAAPVDELAPPLRPVEEPAAA